MIGARIHRLEVRAAAVHLASPADTTAPRERLAELLARYSPDPAAPPDPAAERAVLTALRDRAAGRDSMRGEDA